MDLPALTLVLGGAASGKSAHAERMVRDCGRPRIYLATGQAHDDEMRAKIARHRVTRSADGWHTIEAPIDIEGALGQLPAGVAILLDCATFWLSNVLMAELDWRAEADKLLDALSNAPGPVVIVSNETGYGIVPENALARTFRQAQGELNQMIAARSERVVAVMAGLPLTLKDFAL